MKIILAEERAGGQLREKSFNQQFVRIGRDAADCQIVFDSDQFPMVSRLHAELYQQNEEWFLRDLNSSFGTFINGQKITSSPELSVGSQIQFGLGGPLIRIVRFEDQLQPASDNVSDQWKSGSFQTSMNSGEGKISLPTGSYSGNEIQVPQNFQQNPSSETQIAKLEFISGQSRANSYKITKNSNWLGRDLDGDIIFEASAAMVSRRHAEIIHQNGNFLVQDNGSFNGTLVNENRISKPTQLSHNDEIQLGIGGPILKFKAPWKTVPQGASLSNNRLLEMGKSANAAEQFGTHTVAVDVGSVSRKISRDYSVQPQLLISRTFGDKSELIIGRDDKSDIKLDGLQISNRHARVFRSNADIIIEDLSSTNGIYISGKRIARQVISPEDAVQIGTFLLKVDQTGAIFIFDMRSKARIDSVNITRDVKNRSGGGSVRLLDNVSLSIQPNEFIGLLGPSGAGKSTLMEALNGMRPASGGSVLINNLDLYENLDSLKQSIGYVPQDDIIHRELTVDRTLFYVAKLRLSSDISSAEIRKIIDEVMDVTGLSERRDVPIKRLSGGQRKRVSIAVELITKPSVIFLDEPTSGLDPATEEKIMKLFRQIAESGRTVILTTHAMENIQLFDKIVVLMRGKLAFYGKPDEALKYLNASRFKDLYDKLEEPVEEGIRQSGKSDRQQITEQVAENWKKKFIQTPQYKKNVYAPLKEIGNAPSHYVRKNNRLGVFGSIRQSITLSRRYAEVLLRDKLNLLILLVQAPLIAALTYFVMGANQPRDFVYFILSLVAVWFGTSVAAREIVREHPVFKRERMVNLGLVPYLFSKLFILGIIVGIQCLLLFLPLKLLDFAGFMAMPGENFGIPQFWTMLLTAAVGISIGLLISALVRTSEMATSLVPLILIPQILFSGLVGVPSGINRVAGLIMPATWSFDTMKRFSTLDTLKEEGAEINGETNGLGLYKFVESENNKTIAKAKKDLDEYKYESEKQLEDFKIKLNNGKNPGTPKLDEPPKIADAKNLPENLSKYITFLHPWMDEVLNQIVLMIMFLLLVTATLVVLRLQDIG